jgi:phosphatidylinositol 4-kinase B
VFGSSERVHREKIRANVLPVTVLASIILAGVATPFLPRHAGPLAISQARRPRPVEHVISEAGQEQKISRSNTVSGAPSRPKKRPTPKIRVEKDRPLVPRTPEPYSTDDQGGSDTDVSRHVPIQSRQPSNPSLLTKGGIPRSEPNQSSSSLPETTKHEKPKVPSPPDSAGLESRLGDRRHRRHTLFAKSTTPSTMSREQKIRMLRSNYFRSETAFLTALEDISNRLVSVPKPARLSALRAELALIAQDLPVEVDIPVICPATLEDGQPSRSKHHRIVRLNPAEATSLNSAERVPYLLMVEVIREDFDFNPDSEENNQLLNNILSEQGPMKRRLFDLTNSARENTKGDPMSPGEDSVLEPANGDLGNSSLINMYQDTTLEDLSIRTKPLVSAEIAKPIAGRPSSGFGGRSSLTAQSTPRSSHTDLIRAGSPGARKALGAGTRYFAPDQPDVSALATHMRTAAQMLAQLEQSSSKRPKQEVAAIKAKIIASMQSLEEQSFLMDDPSNPPTFDTIMAKADANAASDTVVFDESIETEPDAPINSGAGVARMENDQITGGVRRIGDRDDPSAITFGEDWDAKKDRIRRSSPFGWMKNWDLVSVIVKTGADLRQEAFACQLIRVCAKIWEAANIPVWTKDMRILVTGESSGLIETITNGVSLHSLKRSLTLASIAEGTNARKRIATLKDHFIKTFGEPETETYRAAVDAFTASLAAYSVISYVLQLKDRHNGNILIDNLGHIVHIDFGFMLSNSPGSMGFEAAPFKLTYEYLDVLGGITSPSFETFKKLCKRSFLALRRDAEKLISLVDIMGRQSQMPCFASGGAQAVNSLRARFVLHLSKEESESFVEELIQKSTGSYYTRLYVPK